MIAGAISHLREYPLVFSGDDALSLDPLPLQPDRLPDEPAEEFAARVDAWAKAGVEIVQANRAKMNDAIERGTWEAVTKPGARPTVFWVRQIPGAVWRAWPRLTANLSAEESAALAFRFGVVRIEDAPIGVKADLVEHTDPVTGARTGLGPCLDQRVVDAFDALRSPDGGDLNARSVVTEIGVLIFSQRSGRITLGKS